MKKLIILLAMLVSTSIHATNFEPPVEAELNDEGVRTYLVEDFNGKGVNDLMVSDLSGSVRVYLGEDLESGLFNDSRGIPNTSILNNNLVVNALASTDFDNDGDLDLALGSFFCENSLIHFAVMLNDGKARFTPAPCVGPQDGRFTYLETGVVDIEAGDLNSDGNADLLVATFGEDIGVYSYLGNGDGTFSNRVLVYKPRTTAFSPKNLTIIDVNMDGAVDIIIHTGLYSPNETLLFVGNGAGDFIQTAWNQVVPVEAPEFPEVQAIADAWPTDYLIDAHIVDDFTGNGLGDIITLYTPAGLNTGAILYVQSGGVAIPTDPVKTKEVDPIEVEEVEPEEVEEVEIEEIEPEEVQ